MLMKALDDVTMNVYEDKRNLQAARGVPFG
jgi:hypothetical protein